MAASNDDSVVAHSSLPAASRVSPSSVVCSTTPLAQTFPQLAQHVVERGARTHSHDSERSSLCSHRGSLARALSSLRSAHRFALLLSFIASSPVFALENRIHCPRFRPRHKSHSPEQSDHTHRSAREQRNFLSLCERVGISVGILVCYLVLRWVGVWDLPHSGEKCLYGTREPLTLRSARLTRLISHDIT